MSWCRWGSPCDFTWPVGLYQVDADCVAQGCPGSSLYIFGTGPDRYECQSCLLDPRGFEGSEAEMEEHIEQHVLAGHHVRQSLRKGADLTLTERYRGTIWDATDEEKKEPAR